MFKEKRYNCTECFTAVPKEEYNFDLELCSDCIGDFYGKSE